MELVHYIVARIADDDVNGITAEPFALEATHEIGTTIHIPAQEILGYFAEYVELLGCTVEQRSVVHLTFWHGLDRIQASVSWHDQTYSISCSPISSC